MSITIDRAGRIVVPKALRERFGLHPGTELEIEAVADGLRLRARDSAPAFIEKEGVLVHHAAGPPMEIDVAAFINREREGRASSITPHP
jgi:AbrB family looped-hinge helix DNA binding protein